MPPKLPAGQAEHSLTPVVENVPGEHGVHDAEAASPAYLPASQAMQVRAARADVSPGGQLSQPVWPSAVFFFPGEQAMQSDGWSCLPGVSVLSER